MFPSRKMYWVVAAAVAALAVPLSAQTNPNSPPAAAMQNNSPGIQSEGTNDSARPSRFVKAKNLLDMKVTNNADEHLGEIEDIVVDAGSGRILYGVLSFGGFLGLGDKLFAIPWDSLKLTGDEKAYVLNVDKDRLKNAQGFDKQHWPDFANEQWATNTYAYYGSTPYWSGSDQSKNDPPANSYRDRWNRPVSVWQKMSELRGKEVRNTQDKRIGEIEEIAMDPDHGRILYGILEHQGKLFAIPWCAFNLSKNAKYAVLNVTEDKLSESHAFTKDKWPNLTDPRVEGELFSYYGQPCPWDRG